MGQRAMIAMMLIAGPGPADRRRADLGARRHRAARRARASSTGWSRERGMGLIFISHDLRLVSSFCDRVIVMYAGKVVEELTAADLAQRPASLYARPAQLHAEDRRTTAIRCRCSTASRSGRHDAQLFPIDRLEVVYRRLPRAEGCQPRRRTGRLLRAGRRIRLRQIDAAARHRRPCARHERARSPSTARRLARAATRPSTARCRWSSRTRTARCIRARPSTACCRSRWPSTARAAGGRPSGAGAASRTGLGTPSGLFGRRPCRGAFQASGHRRRIHPRRGRQTRKSP